MLRWRRLAFANNTYQLKCLQCGWKWRSTRKYAGRLLWHVEESRRGLTDKDVLRAVRSGVLVVDTESGAVESRGTGQQRRLRVREHESPKGGVYRFVSVCSGGKKKDVALHKLVWMAYHKQLVPDGYQVHHKYGSGVVFPDGIGNLELLPASYNMSKQNGGRDAGEF